MNENSELNKYGENFSQWFEWIIREVGIYDYGRYPVKGIGIWLPYGFQIRRNVIEIIRRLLEETGHEEVLFPILIPETLFRKESEHVRGFEDEVLWVTRGGKEELDIKFVLRPTSETAISYMESFWIKSYKQLPKKYYQVVSVFRYETKMTKPMIRVREITTFKEAHTVHENFEDSERQILEAVNIYRKFFDELGIPYLISRRPQWDKFAGALYTIAFDTVFPDGRAIQIGTVHNLGQTFTSVFDVKIQKKDETIDYAWQTSYGISERVIASIIAIHSDDLGLILPSNVAPYSIVIIPIPHQDEKIYQNIINYCNDIHNTLKANGIRSFIDGRLDVKPAEKYREWELKGVPIRIEIGFKEISQNVITLFRRDLRRRLIINKNNVVNIIRDILEEYNKNLRERAWSWLKSKTRVCSTLDEALSHIKEGGGIMILPWCGHEACVYSVLERLEGVTAIGEPLNMSSVVSIDKLDNENIYCAFCGRKAKTFMAIAKRY